MRKKLKIIICILLVLGACAAALVFMLYNGVFLFNNPSLKRYPVRGVDVSSYQGDIDWDVLALQGIQFAYIKATEGSGFVDGRFVQNFDRAGKTGLRVGAYHFFSFASPGETQAQNFISVVPETEGALPPVADVEFYDGYEDSQPSVESIVKELSDFLLALEKHYGVKPVIYATEASYKLYIAGNFDGYDIWIRNVFTAPTLSDGRDWTFWQYTNRELLDGYDGVEKYIDMNVFYGTQEEFDSYGE